MITLDEKTVEAVQVLCRWHGVHRLYVFGSAARGDFDPERSDVDFLVVFRDREPTGAFADRYLGLAGDLEDLLGRRVDLITLESIRNRFFMREVEENRELIYAA